MHLGFSELELSLQNLRELSGVRTLRTYDPYLDHPYY